MFSEIASIYAATRKKREHAWTKYASRPFAAIFVAMVLRTPITPNQVSLLAFVTSLVGAAVLIFVPSYPGLLAGIAIYQLSYILDCADGMLARQRGIASPIGHLLDFMLDEAKAKVFFGAVAIRLYLAAQDVTFLLAGVAGVAVISIALSLTTFIRRPEYPKPSAPPTETSDQPRPVSPLHLPLRVVELVSKQLINYPTYVWLVAIFDRMEIYLWAYLGIYLIYTARTFLQIVLKLGRPGFAPDASAASDDSNEED